MGFALALLVAGFVSAPAAAEREPQYQVPEIPAEFADAPAIVLSKSEHWVVVPRSTESRVQYGRRVLIRSESGLDQANQHFTYDAEESYLELFKGQTICPDGTVTRLENSLRQDELLVKGDGSELRVVKFAFSKVRPGCIVEWETTVRYKGNRGYVWWEAQEELPVLSATFVQRCQCIGWKVQWMHFHRRPIEPLCTVEEGRVDGSYLRWEARCRNLPAFRDEPLAPPEDDARLRMLMLISPDSLQQTRFDSVVDAKLYWRERIKAYARSRSNAVTKGVELGDGTVSDRLDRILRFLAREIEAKSDGPASGTVDEVLATRRAYPFERTMLADALMEGAGLTVVPVLLTDRSHQRFDPDIPDLGQYVTGARVLLRVEDSANRIFVDPACRYCRPGYPDWRYASEGTGGIVLNDDSRAASVILIDPPSVEANTVRWNELATLRADGSADVEGRVTWTHQAEVDRREAWRELTPEARVESFLGAKAGVVEGAVLTIDPVAGPTPLEGTFRYVHPNLATRAGDLLLVPAGDAVLGGTWIPLDEDRQQAVAWRFGRVTRVQSVFRVPDGFRVAHLPPASRLFGPGLRFEAGWERGDGDRTLVFNGRFLIARPQIGVAGLPEARSFARDVEAYLRQAAVLERAGAAPAAGTAP
jgi:hypothetical protein